MKKFLILGLMIMFTSCAVQQTSSDTQPAGQQCQVAGVIYHQDALLKEHIGQQWINPRGVGIGFVWDNERDVHPNKRSQNDEIFLSKGQSFSPRLILHAPEKTTVLVTTLLNYNQIEFWLNGEYGLLHEVTIEPGGDLEIPYQVDLDKEGMHDLVVVAFSDPYNRTLDFEYRMDMQGRMIGKRAVLFVGESIQPVRELGEPLNGEPIPDEVSLSLYVSFATSSEQGHPSDHNRQLYVAHTLGKNFFDYQIWVSNPPDFVSTSYLLVSFFDYHQAKITDSNFLFLALEPGQEKIIDTSTPLLLDQCIYQMQTMYIFDPYKSILGGEARFPFVFSSPRIAIDAAP